MAEALVLWHTVEKGKEICKWSQEKRCFGRTEKPHNKRSCILDQMHQELMKDKENWRDGIFMARSFRTMQGIGGNIVENS